MGDPGNGSGVGLTVREMVLDHDRKLDSLLAWRSEVRGVVALVKITLGTSILSAVVAILAIAAMLSGQAK